MVMNKHSSSVMQLLKMYWQWKERKDFTKEEEINLIEDIKNGGL